MINKIEMKNFKNNNIVQNLTGKDIFVGSNGSGKSSRIESLLLSILGYIPQRGKALQEIYKFSNGQEMAVGLKSDEFTFERKITPNKNNKLTQKIKVYPSKGEKTLLEKEKRIKSEICEIPIVLDFQEFLNMADSERREFIYSISSSKSTTKWDKESIENYIAERALKKISPGLQPLMKKLISDSISQYAGNIENWLDSMLNLYEEKLAYWKQETKLLEATVKKISELKNNCTETDMDLQKNRANLEELQKKLVECEKQITQSSERKKQIDRALKNSKELEDEVKEYANDDIEGKIAELKKYDYEIKINKCVSELAALNEDLKKLQNKQSKIVAAGLQEKSLIEISHNIIQKIEKQNGKCIINPKIKCNKDFSKYISYINENINNTKSKKGELAVLYKNVYDEIKKVQDKVTLLTKTQTDLINNERKANKEISNLTSKLEKIKRLNHLKNELAKSDPVVPLDMLEKEKSAISAEKEKLKTIIGKQEEAQKEYEICRKTSIEYKEATGNYECIKVLYGVLGIKGLQGQIIKDNLDPIKDIIQRNLLLLGIKKKFYFQCETGNGKEIFEFGWMSEGKKVEFSALSTGQKVFLLLAFIAAIIEKTNPKLKIIVIDNIECLDKNNIKNIINGICKLQKAVQFDNIIISGLIYDPHVLQLAQKNDFKIWNCDTIAKEDEKTDEDEEAI